MLATITIQSLIEWQVLHFRVPAWDVASKLISGPFSEPVKKISFRTFSLLLYVMIANTVI